MRKHLLVQLKTFYNITKVRNVSLLSIQSAIGAFIKGFFSWALPILVERVGGVLIVGLIYTIERVLSAPLVLVAGLLMDSYGRKVNILLGVTLELVGLSIIAYLFHNLPLLTTALAIYMSAGWLMSDAISFLLMESVEENVRGTALTLYRTTALVTSLIGSIVLGISVSVFNTEKVILLCIVLTISKLPVVFMLRETLVQKRVDSRAISVVERFKTALGNLRVLRRKSILLVSIFGVLMTFASTLASTYISLYLFKVLSIGFSLLGIIYAGSRILPILSQFIAGRIVDSFGSLNTLIISVPLIGFLIFIMTLTYDPLVAIIALLLIGAIEPFISTADSVLIMKITEQRWRGTVSGALGALSIVASTPAPILGSILWSISPHITMITMSTLVLLGIIPLLVLRGIMKYETRESRIKVQ